MNRMGSMNIFLMCTLRMLPAPGVRLLRLKNLGKAIDCFTFGVLFLDR
jgi:hypothetical protein